MGPVEVSSDGDGVPPMLTGRHLENITSVVLRTQEVKIRARLTRIAIKQVVRDILTHEGVHYEP